MLKPVNFLNGRVMNSDCTVLYRVDPLTMEERQHRILLTGIKAYNE